MKTQKLLLHFILGLSLFTISGQKLNCQSKDKNLNIDLVFIGNSITQGVQLPDPKTDAPPATASEYLRHKPGIASVEFSNQGKSGYTTIDFLPRVVKGFPKVIDGAIQLHTDATRLLVFSISLGTNDSAEKGPNGSPVSPGAYRKNLETIIDSLLFKFPDSKIIIQQPIWYSPTTYNRSKYLAEGLARLQTYFPELKMLVKNYSHTNPHHVFMGDTKAFKFFQKNYLTDLIPESGNAGTFYLHPNKKGAVSLGQFWAEGIYKNIVRN
jgi:lysophospholipase L1-like esterase